MARSKKSFHALFWPLSGEASRSRRGPVDPEENLALQSICEVIARVPRGKVATYGEVARAAGLPGRARQTAYAPRVNLTRYHGVFPPNSKLRSQVTLSGAADGHPKHHGRLPSSIKRCPGR